MKTALVLFVALCGCICIYGVLELIKTQKSVSVLEQRLNGMTEIIKTIEFKTQTANKDSLMTKIRELEFQQDYYTKQLNIQSDWFILYVTVLFGAFAVFGFVVSRQTIADASANYKDAIATQKNIHDNAIKDLKFLTYKEVGHLHFFAAMNFKENTPYVLTQISSSLAQYKLAFYYKVTKEIEKRVIEILNLIKHILTKADKQHLIKIKDKLNEPAYKKIIIANIDFKEVSKNKNILDLAADLVVDIDNLLNRNFDESLDQINEKVDDLT